jgi:transketolase C-terminal domain/subunit
MGISVVNEAAIAATGVIAFLLWFAVFFSDRLFYMVQTKEDLQL